MPQVDLSFEQSIRASSSNAGFARADSLFANAKI
jgi:hypothetical protein